MKSFALSAMVVTLSLAVGCSSSSGGNSDTDAGSTGNGTAHDAGGHDSSHGQADTGAGSANDVSCYEASSKVCNVTGGGSAAKAACSSGGGMVVTSCPTQGLAGCCTRGTGGAQCYYSDGSQEMTGCTGSGGKWSTTVP